MFSGRRITLVQSKHSQWYVEPKMLMAIGDHWCSFGRWGTAGTMVDRIGYSGSVGGISSQSYVGAQWEVRSGALKVERRKTYQQQWQLETSFRLAD